MSRGDHLRVDKYDGTLPLKAHLHSIDNCAKFYGWSESDKTCQLRHSLSGSARIWSAEQPLETDVASTGRAIGGSLRSLPYSTSVPNENRHAPAEARRIAT